ncbi:MAG: hypothetical protein JNK48_25195 [Bryobacterales bacterium]|nr:hypothetical protein [Bryobacterales bacterium]
MTNRSKLEFGDYQTPLPLARDACRLIARLGLEPAAILEPTCGLATFLQAALLQFPNAHIAKGFDISPQYIEAARATLAAIPNIPASCLEQADFFSIDWHSVIAALPQPLLVIGNPPWVTNAALSVAGSANLPAKSNFHQYAGLDALTGKSNFDISEYMLIRLSQALQNRNATLAMLCKTSVARRVLAFCWKNGLNLFDSHIFPIDAMQHFDAAVDACFFVVSFSGARQTQSCLLHDGLQFDSAARQLGYRHGILLADVDAYQRNQSLHHKTSYVWRSGVKHDCAKIMEFSERNNLLYNGLGEPADIEPALLYPLLKSSAIAGSKKSGVRRVLITQRNVGDSTAAIALSAPKTWQYLLRHAPHLDRRASAIYKNRPRFSIFGIGDYSFAPWKVVISGFYKRLDFKVAGPLAGRPVMLDDTAYFLPCSGEEEARSLAGLLNSGLAKDFLSSMIFWDMKRPITVEILRRLSIERLAQALDVSIPPPGSKQNNTR